MHWTTEWCYQNVALWFAVACVVLGSCCSTRTTATITGTVTSSRAGNPVPGVYVMSEGHERTRSDAKGHYVLVPQRLKRSNTPSQISVFFRAEGFRPLTRLAETKNAVLNVALEDAAASEWRVPSCGDVWKTRPVCGQGLSVRLPSTIGYKMEFTLPCGTAKPGAYADADYGGETVAYKEGGKEYTLSTLTGPLCCSGGPGADYYMNSRSWSERSWAFYPRQSPFEGLDARGVSKDGTYWRLVNSDWQEQAGYEGVSEAAAKYFDTILDTMCVQLTPTPRLEYRH